MTTQKERWDKIVNEATADNLAENVRRFFAILDAKETTDEGREFHPVCISSVRILETAKLNAILKAMKEQANGS